MNIEGLKEEFTKSFTSEAVGIIDKHFELFIKDIKDSPNEKVKDLLEKLTELEVRASGGSMTAVLEIAILSHIVDKLVQEGIIKQ